MSTTKGFTLIELLITVSIMAILFMLTAPLLQHVFAKNQAATEINRLVRAINLARHEALKYRALTTLCASADGRQCGGNWHEGMILFLDKKGSGHFDAGDVLLETYAPLTNHNKLYWHSLHTNYIQMSPSGYLKGQNGSFVYCPANKDNNYARAVILSQTGRLRLSTKDADGKPLQCG